MFNDIFKWLTGLVFKPAETWEKLSRQKEDQETFLSRFVYPLIGLIALSAFLGVLFTRKTFDLEIALKASIRAFISSAGGFFLSAYLISRIWTQLFKQPEDTKLCRYFTGYASSLMFALNIIMDLLPEFFFFRFAVLYTVYIIWESTVSFMKLPDSRRLAFSISASAVIIATPLAIYCLLFLLMPGLRL
jgi:hypothetical protein